jgi:hypothetical protein
VEKAEICLSGHDARNLRSYFYCLHRKKRFDVFEYLIKHHVAGKWFDFQELAAGLAMGLTQVRMICKDLHASGLLKRLNKRPGTYQVNVAQFSIKDYCVHVVMNGVDIPLGPNFPQER